MLILFIVAYLTLMVGIGYWASRRVKNSSDFILAGRSLPILLSSAALFATWFGSETVFGASSEFLKGGLYGVIEDPFGAALCLFLFGLFYARRLYNMNLFTLGDFFKVRFGKTTELTACLFLAPPYIGYIAAQLVAMGLIINVITGIAIWQGVIASAVLVTFYTYVGGMWAISITDFLQSIIIILGLGVLAFILTEKAGGANVILREVPSSKLKFLPSFEVYEVFAYIAAWSVLGLGSIPSQDIFQRAMSSASAKVAERSCYVAAFLYLTVAMLPLYISLCSQHLYPQTLTEDTQLALPSMVLLHTPLIVQILFFGSLLSAIMSTTSSAILAPAAIVSENIIRPLIKRQYSDKQFLHITRVAILLFSAMATIMACMRSNIYELVGESSMLSLVSLFVPLTLGLYWKKASSKGALLAMVLGTVTWLIFEVYDTDIPSLIPATVVSLVAMVTGSLVKFDYRSYDKNRN